jgi:hypothetical protein
MNRFHLPSRCSGFESWQKMVRRRRHGDAPIGHFARYHNKILGISINYSRAASINYSLLPTKSKYHVVSHFYYVMASFSPKSSKFRSRSGQRSYLWKATSSGCKKNSNEFSLNVISTAVVTLLQVIS